jgi:CBS domain-containing protein
MANAAAQMLVSATIDFLRAYPPFDRMEGEALDFLVSRLKLAYYAKGATIVSPESGVVEVFRIVHRGKIRARQAGDVSVMEQSAMTLGPGEGFPIGSVTAQRASTNVYTAIDDAFCYELAAEDFFALMQRSPVFNLFCTQYIASLLSQSRQQLQLQFSQRVAEQQTMNSQLAALIKREPVAVTGETPLREAIAAMVARKIGSMVVVDDTGHAIGIFTQSDVLRRVVLAAHPLDAPIHTVMSGSPYTLPLDASAYDAALLMARQGIRHVLAVDEGGRLRGVVSERDLFALLRVGLRQVRQMIDTASSIAALREAAGDVRQLAMNLLAQGAGSEQITQFISALNDTLTRRVIGINLERHDLSGIGWAWLAFGSEGRDEQTLSTDQDNGIVWLGAGGAESRHTQRRLLDFAESVNADLDACGFPLCKGRVMANNPELCLTLAQWEEKFAAWIRAPEPQALLNATIFFDFRPLAGDPHLADELRHFLLRRAAEKPLFLRMLAENALEVAPPLGTFRDFVTEAADSSERAATIDLKKSGARVFIDAARIFALAQGVAATNTGQRLRQSAPAMGVAADQLAATLDAFNFIQLLRLRRQYAAQAQGEAVDNRIRPDELNEVERRILKEAFRQARRIQQRLQLDFNL